MGAISAVSNLMGGNGLSAMGINMNGSSGNTYNALESSNNQPSLNNMELPNQTSQITGQFQQQQQQTQEQALKYNDSGNRQYNDNPLKLKNILDQLNR